VDLNVEKFAHEFETFHQYRTNKERELKHFQSELGAWEMRMKAREQQVNASASSDHHEEAIRVAAEHATRILTPGPPSLPTTFVSVTVQGWSDAVLWQDLGKALKKECEGHNNKDHRREVIKLSVEVFKRIDMGLRSETAGSTISF
jgi:hypothetical protein